MHLHILLNCDLLQEQVPSLDIHIHLLPCTSVLHLPLDPKDYAVYYVGMSVQRSDAKIREQILFSSHISRHLTACLAPKASKCRYLVSPILYARSPNAPSSLPPPLTSLERSINPPAASLPMPARIVNCLGSALENGLLSVLQLLSAHT